MNSPTYIALITAGVALLASAIASFVAWRAARTQHTTKIIELRLSYLMEKRKILRDVFVEEQRRKRTEKEDPSSVESIEVDMEFMAKKLLKCIDILHPTRSEELRMEYSDCLFTLGNLYLTGAGPEEASNIIHRMVKFSAGVETLLRDELKETTCEIEATVRASRG